MKPLILDLAPEDTLQLSAHMNDTSFPPLLFWFPSLLRPCIYYFEGAFVLRISVSFVTAVINIGIEFNMNGVAL